MKEHPEEPVILGDSLTLDQVIAVARGGARVRLADEAATRVQETRDWIDAISSGDGLTIYGVNTGFGSLAEVRIPPKDAETLTRNLILSHSADVGQPLSEEATRATMVIRANQEDHVNMRANAARHAREIVWNTERIVAIEMLCAAQALDLRTGGSSRQPGLGTKAAYQALRAGGIERLSQDRILAPDIERAAELIHTGQIVEAVEAILSLEGGIEP
jgi:histidine ammonia-lyase